jgi:glycosyltransferase involved in cell wall biosynthesis
MSHLVTEERPRISFLIPVFNRRELLEECVRSVFALDLPSYEVVIVDNASTDGTWNLCCRLMRENGCVRAFRNSENVGPFRNWMRCGEHASGTLVKLLFSDDVVTQCDLGKIEAVMAQKDVAFAVSSALVGETIATARCNYGRDISEVVCHRQFLRDVIYSAVPVSPAAAVFRREEFLSAVHLIGEQSIARSWHEHGAGDDLLIYLYVSLRRAKVFYDATPTVLFRVHPGSITIRDSGRDLPRVYRQALLWFLHNYCGRDIYFEGYIKCLFGSFRRPDKRKTFQADIEVLALPRPDVITIIQYAPRVIWERLRGILRRVRYTGPMPTQMHWPAAANSAGGKSEV